MSDLIDKRSCSSSILSALSEIIEFARNVTSALLASIIGIIDIVKWDNVKYIPILNSIYALLRFIIKACQGNWKEAGTPLFWCIITAIGTAIFIYICVNYSCLFVLSSSGIETIIEAGLEFLNEYISNESLNTANWCVIEDIFYERVIKCMPSLTIVWSLVRGSVFLATGDLRSFKDNAIDLIFAVVSLIALYGCTHINVPKVAAKLIGENAFLTKIWEPIRKYALNFIQAVSLRLAFNSIRNTEIFEAPSFKLHEIDSEGFLDCLENPTTFLKNDINHENMKAHMLQFAVNCLTEKYQNCERYDECALQVAFRGQNAMLLQAVLCFWPSVLQRRCWQRMLETMLAEDENDSNRCVKYIMENAFVYPNYDTTCCASQDHQKYSLIKSELILHRAQNASADYRGQRILCIDGGGTKGLISLEILRKLEILLNGRPLVESFDYIFGTSTGALIALLLADNKSITDIRKIYFTLKDKVFSGRKGNLSEYEKLLKEYFPADRKMKSIPNSIRIVIPSTTSPNLQIKYFSNSGEGRDVPIWQVARCTTAAPGYFPPFIDESGVIHLDGGMAVNNPVTLVFQELENINMENSTIVSVGTGLYRNPNTVNIKVSLSAPGKWKMAWNGDLGRLFNLLVDRVTETDDDIVQNARVHCKNVKAYFYRLTPTLRDKIALNETDNEKLINAIWHTRVYVFQHTALFDEIADRLNI